MSNHVWRVKEVSNTEFHVLEYRHGLDTDNPFVLAKCSGPVPANDIMVAMHVQQQLKNNQKMLEGLALLNLVKSAENLAAVLRTWHCLPTDSTNQTGSK